MSKVKILYVEDHDGNIFMLKKRLERDGYDVSVAKDGQEGIMMARTTNPSVILMDLNLPMMDGLEATRHLKASPDTRDIPVIALSAFARYDDREKALAAGCDEYYSKPIDLRMLRAKIHQLTGEGPIT
jgi:CheY-like chemotaxis protein